MTVSNFDLTNRGHFLYCSSCFRDNSVKERDPNLDCVVMIFYQGDMDNKDKYVNCTVCKDNSYTGK